MTQKEEVLMWLSEHKTISTIEASTKLFIADLQGIIRNLKKDYVVLYKWIYTKNKYGRPVRYKRYKCPTSKTYEYDLQNGWINCGDKKNE